MPRYRELETVRSAVRKPDDRIDLGMPGTILEVLGEATYLVEFADGMGRTLSILPMYEDELIPRNAVWMHGSRIRWSVTMAQGDPKVMTFGVRTAVHCIEMPSETQIAPFESAGQVRRLACRV